jgi:hypothetical protein
VKEERLKVMEEWRKIKGGQERKGEGQALFVGRKR